MIALVWRQCRVPLVLIDDNISSSTDVFWWRTGEDRIVCDASPLCSMTCCIAAVLVLGLPCRVHKRPDLINYQCSQMKRAKQDVYAPNENCLQILGKSCANLPQITGKALLSWEYYTRRYFGKISSKSVANQAFPGDIRADLFRSKSGAQSIEYP